MSKLEAGAQEYCPIKKPGRSERFGRAPQQDGCAQGYDLKSSEGLQTCLSTISFLIVEIALAGLRPFGQTCAQFMIVWQR